METRVLINRLVRRVLCGMAPLLCVPILVHAQGGLVTAAMKSDSAAWQMVMMEVVAKLSTQLVRTAHDTTPQPWNLILPADDPQRRFLEQQLRTMLRARNAVATDTVFYTLQLGALDVVHDTARVKIDVSETRRCLDPSRTTGSGWSETVLVARYPALGMAWGAARSLSTTAGDRIGCPRE